MVQHRCKHRVTDADMDMGTDTDIFKILLSSYITCTVNFTPGQSSQMLMPSLHSADPSTYCNLLIRQV